MNKILSIFFLLSTTSVFGQNILVDSQTYSPQQLIEDILINSNCIENVNVTNVVGGNFGGTDQSYGYFDANGSSFPFQSGIVLSTGKLANVEGPNTSLSDDDASGWAGDTDLQTILNEPNTINATLIEFDFTAVASQFSFRYIFASEEYREGSNTTCQYSDLFGFLIRPASSSNYTNIALVPNTQTPVKVTTVHPEIPNGCAAVNEAHFGSWNDATAPINFNGQTAILTATANVVPNETYHVKLVIADEQNYRYDSAVFLEAGSFQLSTDLGPDRILSNNTAICGNETYMLDASQTGNNTYKWFKNGNELLGETNATYEVVNEGTYNVEVTLDNSCVSYGEVVIEYSPKPLVNNSVLVECDQNFDGITYYNLYDAEPILNNNDNTLVLTNFYVSENDAINNVNEIQNPTNFLNTIPSQTVYGRLENRNGCFSVAQLQLQIAHNVVVIPDAEACDGEVVDGISEFDLNAITASFENQIPNDAVVAYYETEEEAFNEINGLNSPYTNTIPYSQIIYAKIKSNDQCFAVTKVNLKVLFTPLLLDDEIFVYCLNSYPETIRLYGGIQNDLPNNYYYEWLFNGTPTSVTTSFNDVNEVGTYTVIVTSPNGCSATRNITVLPSNLATINTITVEEASENNSVSIQVSGEGDYEYALDRSNSLYQDQNVFTNVLPGIHTVYVRDKNGC